MFTAAYGETCQQLAARAGIQVEQLENYNHGLDCNSGLLANEVYCIQAPKTKAKRCLREKQKAAAANKGSSSSSSSSTTTSKAVAAASSTPASSGSSSSSGAPSQYAVPASEATNKVSRYNSSCKWFYTITTEDAGCDAVAAKNNISTDTFYGLNPGLHHAGDHICDNLDTGKAYCVGL